jgi:5-methyltetrahydrofolate--homocysteine methyltransferase
LISDGATGTNLQQRGLEKGESAERWVIEQPEKILGLYSDFVNSGSDIILTSTFGASAIRLQQHHLEDYHDEINQTAVRLAKQAVGDRHAVYVGGSIGPLGQLLQPLGTLSSDDAFAAYAKQALVLTAADVDLLIIETQFDLAEASIAVQAVQSVSSLPLICSFSFDRGKRTMMGVKPEQFASEIGGFKVTALGINCGRSLDENLEVLKLVKSVTDLPIWFKPNAGLPSVDEFGNSVYSISPEVMGEQSKLWVAAGAKIVGGCCGTSPAHLKAIAESLK